MICHVYAVHLRSGKSLREHVAYVTSPEKTIPPVADERHVLLGALPNTMLQELVVTDDGEVAAQYVGAYLTTPEELEERVDYLREAYCAYHASARGDEDPIIAYEIIVSAPVGERVSDQTMYLFAGELLAELRDYPGVWGTHISPVWDEKIGLLRGVAKHDHILISAFPDVPHEMPSKLDLGRWNQRLKEIVDRLAIEHGLQILVDADQGRADSYVTAIQTKRGKSWLNNARKELAELAEEADSWESYLAALEEHSYSVQRLGPKLCYHLPGDHQVMDYRLGRAYTPEYLETRWRAKREGMIDETLDAATELSDGKLFVRIPLGGRFKDATETYRCCLQTQAQYSSEEALKSYYQRDCMYTIEDEDGNAICRAEGEQILRYLGVGMDTQAEASLLPEHQRVYERRLAWHLARIEREADQTCEQYTQSAAVRFTYECRRRRQERAEGRKVEKPKQKPYVREPEEDYPAIYWLVRLLCWLLVPDVADRLWGPKFSEEDFVIPPPNEKLQTLVDAWAIEREENIVSEFDLWIKLDDTRQRYEKLTTELAEIDLQLEDLRPLLEKMERCLSAQVTFDACCYGAISIDEVRRDYPAAVTAYEEAVRDLAQECITDWQVLEAMLQHCRMLEAQRPLLLQAIAAEYERIKKLEIVERANALCREREEREHRKEAQRKPTLDDQIRSAQQGQGSTAKAPNTQRSWGR